MKTNSSYKPLAERMRPQTLDGFFGQTKIVGQDKVLAKMMATGHVTSMILWGPPGVGKTTLALIIAQNLNMPFFSLSAIDSGVKEVRSVIDQAKFAGKAILFIDEIHRFNKTQQDSLLHAVERGYITLIGATTENPSFEVNNALLSRCQVYVLESLSLDELKNIVLRAQQEDDWLQSKNITIVDWDALIQYSDGDARKLLNLFEIVVQNLPDHAQLTNDVVLSVLQKNMAQYDKSGEHHYNIISAFIKSMRGSDPNAAVYWLARMIVGGEDPKFIARRMIIFASEDVGNANPNALLLAQSTAAAIQQVGMPEGRIMLSQCAVYLATSPKSNSTYQAINQAIDIVHRTGDLPVPLHLRNAPTKLMKDLNYGADYKYAHAYDQNFVDQEFLPEAISGTSFYSPGNNPSELKVKESMLLKWKDKYSF